MKTRALIAIMFLFLSGCSKKMDPHPENIDPIYQKMKKDSEDAEKALTSAEKEAADAAVAVSKADMGSEKRENAIDLKAYKDDVAQKAYERSRFTKLQLEKRLIKARVDYQNAFTEGKPWPDPEEFKSYQIMQALQNAPREWSPERRIRQKRAIAQQKAAAAAAAHGGGGHH